MGRVVFRKNARGEEVAELPRALYERLAARAAEADEDEGTARLVARARRAIAAGNEIVLPKAVADRLAAGENPIRVLRKWRGLTQVSLADPVGITQGYLSDLESGKRKGPFALHRKIAHALDVPIDLLMPRG